MLISCRMKSKLTWTRKLYCERSCEWSCEWNCEWNCDHWMKLNVIKCGMKEMKSYQNKWNCEMFYYIYHISNSRAVVTVDHSYIPNHASNWIQTNIQVIYVSATYVEMHIHAIYTHYINTVTHCISENLMNKRKSFE